MRLRLCFFTVGMLALTQACGSRPRPASPAVRPRYVDPHHVPSYTPVEICPAAAQAMVRRFGLPPDSIHQCLSQRFVLAPADTVALAHIAFGKAQDCLAVCVYHHLCALVDKHEILPFAYHFVSATARWIAPGAVDSHGGPEYLTGRRHPIVRDSSFLAFHHAIIQGAWEGVPRSAWRFCTDYLPLDLSSDVRPKPQN